MEHPLEWWRQGGSNPQPRHCERRALPIELCPHRVVTEPAGLPGSHLIVGAPVGGCQVGTSAKIGGNCPEAANGHRKVQTRRRSHGPGAGATDSAMAARWAFVCWGNQPRRKRVQNPEGRIASVLQLARLNSTGQRSGRTLEVNHGNTGDRGNRVRRCQYRS